MAGNRGTHTKDEYLLECESSISRLCCVSGSDGRFHSVYSTSSFVCVARGLLISHTLQIIAHIEPTASDDHASKAFLASSCFAAFYDTYWNVSLVFLVYVVFLDLTESFTQPIQPRPLSIHFKL
jgi:hypothetical protein